MDRVRDALCVSMAGPPRLGPDAMSCVLPRSIPVYGSLPAIGDSPYPVTPVGTSDISSYRQQRLIPTPQHRTANTA